MSRNTLPCRSRPTRVLTDRVAYSICSSDSEVRKRAQFSPKAKAGLATLSTVMKDLLPQTVCEWPRDVRGVFGAPLAKLAPRNIDCTSICGLHQAFVHVSGHTSANLVRHAMSKRSSRLSQLLGAALEADTLLHTRAQGQGICTYCAGRRVLSRLELLVHRHRRQMCCKPRCCSTLAMYSQWQSPECNIPVCSSFKSFKSF